MGSERHGWGTTHHHAQWLQSRAMRLGLLFMVSVGLLVGLWYSLVPFSLAQTSATLKVLRVAANPGLGYTRLVLEAPAGVKHSVALAKTGITVTVYGTRAVAASNTSNTTELRSWNLSQGKSSNSYLNLGLTYSPNKNGWRSFSLPAAAGLPSRLVVDVGPKVAMAKATPPPAPGSRPPAGRKYTVVLDPGHGGVDGGAVGIVTEKEVTLDIGLKTRDMLEAAGVNVIMTRTTDWAWQQDGSRAEKLRDLQARADFATVQRNAFVSIHVNSTPGEAPQGIEVYFFGQALSASVLAQAERENGGGVVGKVITAEASAFARDLLNDALASDNQRLSRRLAEKALGNMVVQTGTGNRGIKTAPHVVTRRSRIPAILVETGFANNPIEGYNLSTNSYRLKVARGISNGILGFLGL
jgi:N-acetylmuramoyl-L-alanine amidase